MKAARRILPALGLLLILSAVDLMAGGSGFGAPDSVILTKLRIPRLLTAILAGASLSLAGLQMQSVFRNPLADPHIMGVSAGAGTGAAAATLLLGASAPAFLSGFTIAAAAFAGALLTSVLVMAVSYKIESAGVLLIFGVMLGFVFSAVTSVLQYSANEESLKVFQSWAAGSFTGNRPDEIVMLAIMLLLSLLLAILNRRGLDIILFGDEYAALAGADAKRIRNIAMFGCCLSAGAVTSICGPLGFVGIAGSHIARAITGTSVHRVLIPVSIITGSALAVLADILSQAFPVPLPAGSTMALIGIPVVLAILFGKR